MHKKKTSDNQIVNLQTIKAGTLNVFSRERERALKPIPPSSLSLFLIPHLLDAHLHGIWANKIRPENSFLPKFMKEANPLEAKWEGTSHP